MNFITSNMWGFLSIYVGQFHVFQPIDIIGYNVLVYLQYLQYLIMNLLSDIYLFELFASEW